MKTEHAAQCVCAIEYARMFAVEAVHARTVGDSMKAQERAQSVMICERLVLDRLIA